MMTDIRERLREMAMPPLRLVDQVAEWSALKTPPADARLPAAYVLPLGSQPGANGLVNAVRQRVVETVGVVLIARNLRDRDGGAAIADVVEVRDQVRAALLGWTPAAGWEPILLGPGRLIDASGGLVVWQETYTSAVLLRGA